MIFSSDHGTSFAVQEPLCSQYSEIGGDSYPGESRTVMHGPSDGGNECYISFYSKQLKTTQEKNKWIAVGMGVLQEKEFFYIRLYVVDVCATLSLYFPGVSIPAESIGMAHPSSNDPVVVSEPFVPIFLIFVTAISNVEINSSTNCSNSREERSQR
jgi:hypothetical protein